MTDRDWRWITEEHPMLKDIKDYMLPPYAPKDIEQWGASQEKRRAQDVLVGKVVCALKRMRDRREL